MTSNFISGELIKTKQGVDSKLIYLEDAGFKGVNSRLVKVRCINCNDQVIKVLSSIKSGKTYSCGKIACRDTLRNSDSKRYNLGDMVTSHYRFIGEDLEKSIYGRRWIKVMCACGQSQVQTIRLANLTKRAGCRRCGYDRRIGFVDINETSAKALFGRYVKSAKTKKFSFELDYDFFLKIIKSNCFYCDEPPFKLSKERKRSILYTGIDRIDCQLGYLKDNVQPCCSICNNIKRSLKLSDFLAQLAKIKQNLKPSDCELYVQSLQNRII